MTGLYTFLMQSVIFTPPRINSYVRETLAALNYKQNCERFGMFFVDLDDPIEIANLPVINPTEILRELKLTTSKQRKSKPTRDDENETETEYPLGEAPTWKEITRSLLTNPTDLVPRWKKSLELEAYNEIKPGTPEAHAVDIFLSFTCHLWVLLHPHWRLWPERNIKPTTIEDALQCWSVDSIIGEVSDVEFKPCHTGHHSGPGRPSMSFSERRKLYFPAESKRLTKIWKHLVDVPGYIGVYRNHLGQLDTTEKSRLDECLEELLVLCQCLPDSSRTESGGWIWRVEQKKIVVITNPSFYRIKKVGKRPSGRNVKKFIRSAPAQRGIKSATVAMVVVQEEIPRDVAERAYRFASTQKARLNQKSARAKNARKPPQRRRTRESSGQSRKRKSHPDSDLEPDQPYWKKRQRIEETDWEDEELEDSEDSNSEDEDVSQWDRGSDADDEEEGQ